MFAKVFGQILDSSIASDSGVRHMFMDMLVLADRNGVVDMTYDAVARRTNVPIDKVVAYIGELMKADPASRSEKMKGARLAFIDSGRDWGWQIVNYEHYRNLRDEDARRAYFRDKMRESRQNKKTRQPVKDVKGSATPSGDGGSHEVINTEALTTAADAHQHSRIEAVKSVKPVKRCERPLTYAEADAEADLKVPSAVSLKGRHGTSFVTDYREAKRLICARILDGKNPERIWSPDAENRLARMCQDEGGIPLQEIDDIAWYRGLSKEAFPELKNRRDPITETTLMQYWGDEAHRAGNFRKRNYGGADIRGKPDPTKWREFFQWKHENPHIVLPTSFWLLSRDRQQEYEEGFSQFEQAMAPRWQEFFHWKYSGPIRLPTSFYMLEPDQRAEYWRDFQTFIAAEKTPTGCLATQP